MSATMSTIYPERYPTVTCQLCGTRMRVMPDGRGFPPDIAKRKLIKDCKARGCACDPIYLAGVAW